MKIRSLKYLFALTLPITVAISFTSQGWLTLLPLIYFYGFVPLLELALPSDPSNLSKAEAELRRHDPIYDYMLYMLVPIQYGFLIWFLVTIGQPELSWTTVAGHSVTQSWRLITVKLRRSANLAHLSTRQIIGSTLLAGQAC